MKQTAIFMFFGLVTANSFGGDTLIVTVGNSQFRPGYVYASQLSGPIPPNFVWFMAPTFQATGVPAVSGMDLILADMASLRSNNAADQAGIDQLPFQINSATYQTTYNPVTWPHLDLGPTGVLRQYLMQGLTDVLRSGKYDNLVLALCAPEADLIHLATTGLGSVQSIRAAYDNIADAIKSAALASGVTRFVVLVPFSDGAYQPVSPGGAALAVLGPIGTAAIQQFEAGRSDVKTISTHDAVYEPDGFHLRVSYLFQMAKQYIVLAGL